MRLAALAIVLFLAFPSSARQRATGRTFAPLPPSAEATFDPNVAVIPTSGWSLLAMVNGGVEVTENPVLTKPHTITVTVRTWGASEAPWSDAAWRATNPRLIAGVFEVPIYRLRKRTGAPPLFCRVDALMVTAQPGQVVTATLDVSRFGIYDYVHVEGWKGYSQTVEARDISGALLFSGTMNAYMTAYPPEWVTLFGPQHRQSAWAQNPVVMGCD